jgi:hypothetical protein
VGVDQLVAVLHGEVDQLARAVPAHPGDQRVVGVEDPVAVAGHGLDHHLLDRGQLLEGVDAAQAQVVGADVEDHPTSLRS